MQKKLIALAIAGLASSAAFAQSNVQIYGLLDMGYRVGTASGAQSTAGIASASSNLWGIKGTEDLGNGLKAGFVLEGGISSDTGAIAGTGKIFGRQSYLSLSGNFGTALIGRMNTFGRANAIKFAPSPYSAVDTLGNLTNFTGFTIAGNGADGDNTGARLNNAVAYVLPKFVEGVTVGLAHSFHEAPTAGGLGVATTGANVNEVSVNYDNGPVALGFVHNTVGAIVGNGTLLPGSINENFFGASYDFGVLKLMGSYQTRKIQNVGDTDKAYQIGIAAPISARDTVTLSYAKLDLSSTGLQGTTALARGLATLGQQNNWDDATGWAASYKHDLSKRTNAYVAYSRIKNSGIGSLSLGATSAPTAGGTSSSFIAGLQHAF